MHLFYSRLSQVSPWTFTFPSFLGQELLYESDDQCRLFPRTVHTPTPTEPCFLEYLQTIESHAWILATHPRWRTPAQLWKLLHDKVYDLSELESLAGQEGTQSVSGNEWFLQDCLSRKCAWALGELLWSQYFVCHGVSGHYRCDEIPRDLCWLPNRRSTRNILLSSVLAQCQHPLLSDIKAVLDDSLPGISSVWFGATNPCYPGFHLQSCLLMLLPPPNVASFYSMCFAVVLAFSVSSRAAFHDERISVRGGSNPGYGGLDVFGRWRRDSNFHVMMSAI